MPKTRKSAEPAASQTERAQPPESAAPATLPARKTNKLETLIELLHRPEGATLVELQAATGWQAHSVRGALAGALKKRLGHAVVSEKTPERGRLYRAPAAAEQPPEAVSEPVEAA